MLRCGIVAIAIAFTAGCERDDQTPSAVSVTPRSGGGWGGTFQLIYSAPKGFSDLVDVRVLFNRTAEAAGSCYVIFDPVTNVLRLGNDLADKFMTIPLGSGQVGENSQCSVSALGSSISGSGSRLTLRLAARFKPAFAGVKNIYMLAQERTGRATGLRRTGTWSVPYSDQ